MLNNIWSEKATKNVWWCFIFFFSGFTFWIIFFFRSIHFTFVYVVFFFFIIIPWTFSFYVFFFSYLYHPYTSCCSCSFSSSYAHPFLILHSINKTHFPCKVIHLLQGKHPLFDTPYFRTGFTLPNPARVLTYLLSTFSNHCGLGHSQKQKWHELTLTHDLLSYLNPLSSAWIS